MKIKKLEDGSYLVRIGPTCVNFEYGIEVYRFLKKLHKVYTEGGEEGIGTNRAYYKITEDKNGRKATWISCSRGGNYIMSMCVSVNDKKIEKLFRQFQKATKREGYKQKVTRFLSTI